MSDTENVVEMTEQHIRAMSTALDLPSSIKDVCVELVNTFASVHDDAVAAKAAQLIMASVTSAIAIRLGTGFSVWALDTAAAIADEAGRNVAVMPVASH